MKNSLSIHLDCSDLLDHTVANIFKRVAGLDLIRTFAHPMKMDDLFSLVIMSQGDYKLALTMCTDSMILKKMTEYMKHQEPLNEGDIPIYTTEFFNILCGHFISSLNKLHHCSARFSIPQFVQGHHMAAQKEQGLQEYFYDCEFGIIKIEIIFYQINVKPYRRTTEYEKNSTGG